MVKSKKSKSKSSAASPAQVLQIPGKLPKSASKDPEDLQVETMFKQKEKRKGTVKGKDRKEVQIPAIMKDAQTSGTQNKELASGTAEETASESRPAPRVLQMPGRSFSSEKRRFMSDKVADIRSKPQAPKQKRKAGDTEESAEFKKTLKDVLNFVVPQLGKVERRQYEQAKIRALGGTLEKRPFEPYGHLQRQHKKEEVARQNRLEKEKTLGVSLSVVKQRRRGESVIQRKAQERLEKKRRKDNDILGVGAGARERGGMVVLSKKKFQAYS